MNFHSKGVGDVLVVGNARSRTSTSFSEDEVGGGEDLTLDEREVDLDRVEPTGMDGWVRYYDVRADGLQMPSAGISAMRGGVVHDPENPAGSINLVTTAILGARRLADRASRCDWC